VPLENFCPHFMIKAPLISHYSHCSFINIARQSSSTMIALLYHILDIYVCRLLILFFIFLIFTGSIPSRLCRSTKYIFISSIFLQKNTQSILVMIPTLFGFP
jgi:hypothetical protein